MALQRLFNGTTLIWGPDVTFDIMNKNVSQPVISSLFFTYLVFITVAARSRWP